jgi:hypothetical protein
MLGLLKKKNSWRSLLIAQYTWKKVLTVKQEQKTKTTTTTKKNILTPNNDKTKINI